MQIYHIQSIHKNLKVYIFVGPLVMSVYGKIMLLVVKGLGK